MLFTAKQTIGNMFLMLPYTSHPFLYRQCIWQFAYLLKLIDTDYQVYAFLLGYDFWKI